MEIEGETNHRHQKAVRHLGFGIGKIAVAHRPGRIMVVFGCKITQAGLYLPVLGQAVAQRELRLRGRGDFGNRSICRARIIEISRKRPVLIIGVEVGIDIKRIPAEGQIVLNIFFETRLQVEVAVFRKIHTAAEAGH